MKTVLAIAGKEIRLLVRDPGGLSLLFVMPSVFVIIMSVALQGAFSQAEEIRSDRGMRVLLVDLDEGDIGERIEQALEETGHFRVVRELDGEPLTRERALRSITHGDGTLAVVVPEGSTEALVFEKDRSIEVLVDPVLALEIASGVETAVQSVVLVAVIEELERTIEEMEAQLVELEQAACEMDGAITDLIGAIDGMQAEIDNLESVAGQLEQELRRIEKAAAKYPAAKGLFPGMKQRLETLAEEQEAREPYEPTEIPDHEGMECVDGRLPESAEARPAGELEGGLTVERQFATSSREPRVLPNTVQQNVPGWTIFALFWIAQIFALNLLGERNSGAWTRILVSPVSVTTYMIGKVLPFVLVNLAQAVCMFLIGVFVLPFFGCPRLEITDPLSLLVVTLGISLASIGLGLFMASLSRSTFLVASVTATLLIIMAVLGGIMVPRFVMPPVMQQARLAVPHAWALDGYQDVLVRGQGLVDILPETGVVIAFAVLFFALAIWRFSATIRR